MVACSAHFCYLAARAAGGRPFNRLPARPPLFLFFKRARRAGSGQWTTTPSSAVSATTSWIGVTLQRDAHTRAILLTAGLYFSRIKSAGFFESRPIATYCNSWPTTTTRRRSFAFAPGQRYLPLKRPMMI
jgi:hypothetical protein